MLLKSLKYILIESQIFVAMMATALSLFFLLNFNALNYIKLGVIGLLYLNGYLYTKFQNHSNLFYKIITFNVISLVISILIIICLLSSYFLFSYFVIILLGVLYNSKFLTHYTRNIPLMKIFYVGFCWALINTGLLLETWHWQVFFITWCYISALIIPFDIRDIRHDSILTFPRYCGISKSKLLAYSLLAISSLLVLFAFNSVAFFAFQIAIVIAFLFIFYAQEHRSDWYFSLGVESCVGLPLLFFVLLK